MLTAVPPLNPQAAQAASKTLARKHPELANLDGSLKPIDPNAPNAGALRQEWTQAYVAEGGKAQVVHPPQRPAQVQQAQKAARALPLNPPGSPALHCPAVAAPGSSAQLRAASPAPPLASAKRPCPPAGQTCGTLKTTMKCSHKRAPSGGLLEVVPTAAGDTISLTCSPPACGKPPSWPVSGDEPQRLSGTAPSFSARSWLVQSAAGAHWAADANPRTYRVHAATECGARSSECTVRCYPSDKFSLTINGKAWVEMKSKIKYLQEVIIGAFLPNFECVYLEGKLDISAGWEEDGDSHLAYYGWKVAGSFDPLLGFKGRFPFGPLAAIPQWFKKYGDAYLFVEFSGGIGCVADWGRTGPKKVSGSFKATGKIGGKIGGSMFFARKTVLVMEVAGSSGVTVEAEPRLFAVEVPECQFKGKWDGLKVEITIIAARGIIEFKREFKVCDEREFLDATYVLDVKAKKA